MNEPSRGFPDKSYHRHFFGLQQVVCHPEVVGLECQEKAFLEFIDRDRSEDGGMN